MTDATGVDMGAAVHGQASVPACPRRWSLISPDDLRDTSLQWSTWLLATLLGSQMLIVPHQLSSQAYDLVRPQIAIWGGAMLLAGTVQLIAAFCDYEAWACRINWRAVRYYTALLLIALWAFISITFIRANPGATSTAVYPIFAASDIWVYWRLHVLGRHGTQ